MKITYYGHSCILVETMGTKVLFDPFITHNPIASHIDVDSIEADYILISHGHQDHLADAASIADRTKATIITNYEISEWYSKQAIKPWE